MLPNVLQVTFQPDMDGPSPGVMIWWGTDNPAEAARSRSLPEGAAGRLRLVTSTEGGLKVGTHPVRLVRLEHALPALYELTVGKNSSDSLRAWHTATRMILSHRDSKQLEELAAAMPAAAYPIAVDGNSIWEPESLLRVFQKSVHSLHSRPTQSTLPIEKPAPLKTVDVSIKATLRPYQQFGVAWLQRLAEYHGGGILADDMGLGKTLQTIALLTRRRPTRPHLVVCPTSLLGNWARELTRFAPGLRVLGHHGPRRLTHADSKEPFPSGAVVVTSYSLMLRDLDLLSRQDWDVVVLDEAQQIKNHTSQTARASRMLPAQVRLALTGTPIENRLSELWSIMDFANPGVLGSYRPFLKRFAEPIEKRRDARAAKRLRQTIEPFVLRRMKSEVATDLPPKQESLVVCTLTPQQARLYRQEVDDALNADLGSGFERHGRVLRLLTRLKQICNHPAQYLGKDDTPADQSGKLTRVSEMLTETVAEGTAALVFTQYRVMGEILAAHLARTLDLSDVPFLHGGVARTAREKMVDEFQAGHTPVMIVSLKAGGTGLNLTAATTVVHYDRWWNPAVEDQATDRAHRIGQDKPVDVYKLVTGGTLEERIADLLERKRSLAEAVTGTGEDWITHLDDTQLRRLVTLSQDVVAE